MKTCFHALIMCRSMFCALPAPQLWDEKARDKMLLFLPLVGLELGVLWELARLVCCLLCFPAPIRALVLCVFPFLVTGFIHLDGFMDVTDALRSWRSVQRRQEILKDPHVGSFAVIGVVLLILSQYALFCCAEPAEFAWVLLLLPAVSRCCSALAVTCLPPMQTSQYAGQNRPAAHIAVLATQLAVLLAAGFLLCGRNALALLGCLAGYALALRRGYRSLQGMNGDIAGYALTIGELCAVAVLTLLTAGIGGAG